ncbi:hypothetical protein DPMN_102279 [Dreissena polymorpha]|uniref:Uncharacterized protein n=1 Tax=Dreissena polymorpha TaxID=45954 RepID=A0A9D4LKN5_DREPO|nr:hypothetical protein DPMN_102279 [Dreissena polymorpha]
MRLLNYLLETKELKREDNEYYLVYAARIFEFAEKYEWNSILYYDFRYRELQVEDQFNWGTFSPYMELQKLAPGCKTPRTTIAQDQQANRNTAKYSMSEGNVHSATDAVSP